VVETFTKEVLMRFRLKGRQFTWTFLVLLTFFIFPFLSLAQQSVVGGMVVDRDENPLKNVKIVFTDKDRGTKFTMKSDKNGKFMKVGIPPALYVISVDVEGYYPLESEYRVNIGSNKGLKLILEKVPPKVEQVPDITEGTRLFQEEKFSEAILAFQKALEKLPDSVDANYGLALSLLRSGKVDEAISYFEKVRELRPEMVEVYLALGESYFKKGENDKALTYFHKALELEPNNAEIYYNIGIILYQNDQTEEAIKNFSTSKSLDPKYAPTWYELGICYIKKGETDKAIHNLERFLEMEPDSPLAPQVKNILEALKKQE
jgi:Flp pilus assembly protein TadD